MTRKQRRGTGPQGPSPGEGLFRRAFDSAPFPRTITRLDTGEFVHVNRAFTSVLGWTVDEVVGKSTLDLGIFPDREVRARLIDTVRRHGFVADAEVRLRAKSGAVVHALVSLEAVEDGTEVLLIGSFQDLTAQRALEQALLGQEGLVRAIVDGAGDAIVGLDLSNRVTLVNRAAARMLAYEPDQLLGQSFHDVAHHSRPDGSPYPREECPLYETTRHGESQRVDGEVLWRRDGVPVPVEYTTSPVVVDGEIMGAAMVARDVTAQIEVRWVLAEAMRRAEKASAAKSAFLSHMSHELRTPLNAVLGFTELLSMRVTDPEIAADLRQIERAGHHLLNLINDVLDIGRVEEGRLALSLEPTSLPEVVAEVASLMGPLADEVGVAIRTDMPPGLYVQADVQRLRQVLLNLLSNGIKYNRPGGSVLLGAGLRDGRVAIAVRDTGRGINPARLPRLFDPFERVTGDASGVEGTGLGLALSQRLVHAMSGLLEVESIENEGTVFTVVLESAEPGVPADQPTLPPPAPAAAARPVRVRVLYVEDNPANMRLVEAALRTRPNVTMIMAATGGIGVELALRKPPDLVLLDLQLPDMNGQEVLRRLRADERTRGCRVVVLSADATKERIQQLLADGADAYLTKPLRLPTLFEEIDRLAERLDPPDTAAGGEDPSTAEP
ncbi:MAG TPA: PAS domain S-box protein [Acidimicrobiia bacterium]|nr:PAS domain S-box protein [Acidimicrobiia bacterium]